MSNGEIKRRSFVHGAAASAGIAVTGLAGSVFAQSPAAEEAAKKKSARAAEARKKAIEADRNGKPNKGASKKAAELSGKRKKAALNLRKAQGDRKRVAAAETRAKAANKTSTRNLQVADKRVAAAKQRYEKISAAEKNAKGGNSIGKPTDPRRAAEARAKRAAAEKQAKARKP